MIDVCQYIKCSADHL